MAAITFFLNKNILFNNFLFGHRRILNILICFGFCKFSPELKKEPIKHVSEKLVIDTLHKEEFQLTAVVIKPSKQETLQLNVNVFATGDALLYRPNLKPNIHMSNPQNCHTNH